MRLIICLMFLLFTKGVLFAKEPNLNMESLSEDIFTLRKFFDPLRKKNFTLIKILKINPFGSLNVVVAKILLGNNYCVLKEIPPYCANFLFLKGVLLFRESLRKKGVPIPTHIQTYDHHQFAILNFGSKRQKIYLLEEFVDGKNWNKSSFQISSMAHTLAQLHKASASLFLSGCFSQHNQVLHLLPQKSVFDVALRLTNVALEVLKNKHSLSLQEKQAIEDFIQQCQATLLFLKKSAMDKGYGEMNIPIHGDYNPTNIIFNEKNKVVGVIDFDDCCIDNPIHDILTALLCMFYFTFEKQENLFLDKYQAASALKKARLFLSAYFEYSFFTKDKIKAYLEESAEAVAIQCLVLYLIKELYTDYLHLTKLSIHVDRAKHIIKSAFTEK